MKEKNSNKLMNFWTIAVLTVLLMPNMQIKSNNNIQHLTIENDVKEMEHEGKKFHPDDLHALFFENTNKLHDSCIEAKSLETRLLRLFSRTPTITLIIPDKARLVQIRSLFDSHRKPFASTELIRLKPNANITLKITGPEKKRNRSELLINHALKASK